MGRIAGHYVWDDDELIPGQKKEGGLHQNLFDEDGNLKGSARFIPSDEEHSEPLIVTETVYVPVEERRRSKEQEALDDAIGELIFVLIATGISKAKPHVQQWWGESFRPFVKKQWSKIKNDDSSVKKIVNVSDEEIKQETASDTIMQDAERQRMSSAEAQARMLAAIAAQAFADEQMRLVNSSKIVDDGEGEIDSVREAISKLPTEIVAEIVKRMAINPSMLEEGALAELASVLAQQDLSKRAQSNTRIVGQESF